MSKPLSIPLVVALVLFAAPFCTAAPKKAAAPKHGEKAIRRALAKPINVEFVESPLEDVVEFFRDATGIQILIDHNGLAEAGMSPDKVNVTLQVSGISARSALDLILEPQELTWLIHHDVLYITTLTGSEELLETKVYDVTDLVVFRNELDEPCWDFEHLTELIMAAAGTPDPGWEDCGGLPGSSCVQYQATGINVLVVRHTRKVHEQIAALLAKLREKRQALLSTQSPSEKTAP